METLFVDDDEAAAESYKRLMTEGVRDAGAIVCRGKGHPCIFMWTDCSGKLHERSVAPGKSLTVSINKVVFEGGSAVEKCVSETWKCKS